MYTKLVNEFQQNLDGLWASAKNKPYQLVLINLLTCVGPIEGTDPLYCRGNAWTKLFNLGG